MKTNISSFIIKIISSCEAFLLRFIWRNWSIRTRLMLIAIFPIGYLFLSVVSYSYYARFTEVQDELVSHANTASTALAEGLEYNLLSGNVQGIKQMINGVIQSDHNIYRIDIFDAKRNEVTYAEHPDGVKPEKHFLEKPILRQLVWVNLLGNSDSKSGADENTKREADKTSALLGYVRITMTSTLMMKTQKNRFGVELMMSILALIVSTGLAWFLSSSLTQPLKAAINVLRDIRRGDNSQQLKLSTGGEVGELQLSINEMALSLHQAKQHLENKVEERTRELMLSRNEALKADAEKRRLIHKVNSIVEAERQSIAVEIHDELNASLIAVRLESERIAKIAAKFEPDERYNQATAEIQERAKTVIKLALDLYANGRNLVRRLRPEVLELMGLQGAVEEMVRVYNDARSDCQFSFSTEGDFSHLDTDVAISAYRIVQEATSNILKHATAKKAHIELAMEEHSDAQQATLSIAIQDNGKGFDTGQVAAGIGITGMRERVLVLEGEFKLNSQIGEGTQILIKLPKAGISENRLA